MANRILLPILPTERFYDAVVAAADLIAAEGGTLTFMFTTVRPPPGWLEDQPSQTESQAEIEPADLVEDDATVDAWQDDMLSKMDQARELIYERGVSDEQVSYVFGDFDTSAAQAVADEAAAGGYDVVILSRGELVEMSDEPGMLGNVRDIAAAVQEIADEGVKLLVT